MIGKCSHGRSKSNCSICSPHRVYSQYRRKARERNLTFDLSFEEFELLVQGECNYCGAYPALGIDRRRIAYSYTVSNSVSCCWNCNKLKGSISDEQTFLSQVMDIARYQEYKKQLRKKDIKAGRTAPTTVPTIPSNEGRTVDLARVEPASLE